MCRPDLVAISGPSSQALQSLNTSESQSSDGSYRPQPLDEDEGQSEQIAHWVEVETVVEIVSNGTPTPDGTKQAIAYTSYLLMQRPDRVAVLGLYISVHHFSLILVDATRVYYTTLHWNDKQARNLLLRVLCYINDPPTSMTDSTITRKEHHTFAITNNEEVYTDYTIKTSAHPIGRRTVVFQNEGSPFPVIKEQYLRCPPTATEAEILEHIILGWIHQPEEMPGVVRVAWCGLVRRADKTIIECGSGDRKRQKARLVLLDEGVPFTEIKSPYYALVTAWDTLEGEWPYPICDSPLTRQN